MRDRPPQTAAAALAEPVRQNLWLAAAMVTVVTALMLLRPGRDLEGTARWIESAPWIATVAVLGPLALRWRRRPPPAERAHTALGLIALAVVGGQAPHVWFHAHPWQATGLLLIILASGQVMLSRAWLGITVAAAGALWFTIAVGATPDQQWIHFSVLLAAGAVVAGAVEEARRHTILQAWKLRRRVEDQRERLAATNEELAFNQFVIDHAPDPVLWVSRDGAVRRANRAAARMLGARSDEEGPPPALAEIFSEVTPERFDELWEQGGSDDAPPWETTVRGTDGRTVPLEIKSRRLASAGEELLCIFARDVTERSAAEDQLQRSQKLESLARLAGGVAHDFNNLLVAVNGNAALLSEQTRDAHTREVANDILQAGERAAMLTHQLLDYTGTGTQRREVFDLGEELRSLTRLLWSSTSKTAELEIDVDAAEALTIRADRSQIQQVVMNLVINAAEAIGDAEGHISLHAGLSLLSETEAGDLEPRTKRRAGVYVVVEVADDGPGISEDVRGRIFDPFFSTKQGGRGLGLAAALGIARAHGGGFSIESQEGRGSVFRLFLPRAPRAEQSAAERAPVQAPAGDQRTVLVVDDDEQVRRVARRSLEAAGFRVDEARDGRAAIRALTGRPGRYAAVVLDIAMPGIGGVEVFRHLREDDPELPVVFSSGYDSAPAVTRSHSGLPTVFLRKPYRGAALVNKVASIARNAASEPAAAEAASRHDPGD